MYARTGKVKMLENSKDVYCTSCKKTFEVFADVEQYNQMVIPTKCLAQGNARPCPGTKFQTVETPPGQLPKGCRDYQEIKIQEQTTKLAMGTIPRSMFVILHDDLVDYAKSGDDVTITRWKPPIPGERCDIELALLANHVFIYNEQRVGVGVTEEQLAMYENFWLKYRPPGAVVAQDPALYRPFTARNKILAQICPQVYGLYIVKLAVMLILTGGVQKVDKSGLKVRGEPHLLLVGDPGTGKSQFLKYAAELNPRSVLTTGIGSSSAGLTVTAVRDGSEWQLEAGALVLADRGLCCIDEFGGMREHDKTAIHEAMEQQSISIAKAGIVCKLNTRCSVIAATNPKGKYDPEQSVSINIALASPLLSRFDLVLVLMDTGNPNWDHKISSFILDAKIMAGDQDDPHRAMRSRDVQRARRAAHRRKRRMLARIRDFAEQGNLNSSQGLDHGRDGDGNENEDARWSIEKLKAYLIWIKTTFEPKLTPPAEQVLVAYYQLQRKADVRNAARTTIRLLESLIRLSQAHARLMAKHFVTVEDAVAIVSLMEATVQGGAAMLGGVNPLHASFPKNAEEEYLRQEDAMLGRLGLRHLASTMFPPGQQRERKFGNAPEEQPLDGMDDTNGTNDIDGVDEWRDVKVENTGESVIASSATRSIDLNQFRMVNKTRGARAPRPRQPRQSSAGPSSTLLNDDDEEEMLARLRREEVALDTIVKSENDLEESLLDQRTNRRLRDDPKWKGKGVDRSDSGAGVTQVLDAEVEEEEEEEDNDNYGLRPPGGGSIEL
ncbi:DNA helicase mcm9 [Podila epigama]|nr:DNA helicase mcm9 [Podila epigama]